MAEVRAGRSAPYHTLPLDVGGAVPGGGKELGGGKGPSSPAQPITDHVNWTSQMTEVLIYPYKGGGWVGAIAPCNTHRL